MREVFGSSIGTVDGTIGHVVDAYFDDRHWNVRHLVVDSGYWLLGRKVLISSRSVREVDLAGRILRTDLTRREVTLGPSIDSARPVSRQHELELSHYYGFPSYAVTVAASLALVVPAFGRGAGSGSDRHLRSVRTVTGYYLHALDGDVGHVQDLLVDGVSWVIRYLVASVGRSWWPARRVLLPIGWVTRVSWGAGTVEVSLPAETIRLAPEHDRASRLTPEQERRLVRYYGPAPLNSTAKDVEPMGPVASQGSRSGG